MEGSPLTSSLRAHQSCCFAGWDLLRQSQTSVLAALHRLWTVVKLMLTVGGGLCPLRRRCAGDEGWAEGPAQPGGSIPSPGDWWSRVRSFFWRLGKVVLPAPHYEVFVSKKNSPGQWVTSCRWHMTALRFILLDKYSISYAGELTLPRCKHSSALWFHRHCWFFLISHLFSWGCLKYY